MLVVNNDGITSINEAGVQGYNIIKNTSSPCVNVAGSYIALYDRGGKSISTYKGSSKIAEITVDQPIITAKINSAGYLAVVSEEVGYKSKIEIYDHQGDMVYKWQISEKNIIDVDIAPNCKYFATASLTTQDNVVNGTITFIDIQNENVMSETKRVNSILMSIKFAPDSSLVAVGESELLGFNNKGENKWSVNYDSRILESYILQNDCNAILLLSSSRNNSAVEIYSKNGKKTGSYISDYQIKAINAVDGSIAIAEQRNIKLLNYSGKVKTQKTVQKDIRDIVLFSKNSAAIIYGNGISLLKL